MCSHGIGYQRQNGRWSWTREVTGEGATRRPRDKSRDRKRKVSASRACRSGTSGRANEAEARHCERASRQSFRVFTINKLPIRAALQVQPRAEKVAAYMNDGADFRPRVRSFTRSQHRNTTIDTSRAGSTKMTRIP